MKTLQLKQILLDTSFFMRNNFDFVNRNFLKIKELSLNKEYEFYITEVIKGEILKNLNELSEKLKKALYQFERNCPNSIIDLETHQRIEALKLKIEESNLEKSFLEYLSEADIKVIGFGFFHSEAEDVFRRYFNRSPPFKMKKDEFPDAFTLSMFNNAVEGGLVVSGDNDFDVTEYKNIEKNFQTIEDFFDYTNKVSKSEYDVVRQIYNKIKNSIRNKIEEHFPNYTFLNFKSSHYENPVFKEIYIQKEDVISIENGVCNVEIEGQIMFSVELQDSKTEEIGEYHGYHIVQYIIEFSFVNESVYEIKKITPKTGLETIVAIGDYPE